MKPLKLFLEDFKQDEEELQSNKPISNIDLAHSLALTTCSFEFECYLAIEEDELDVEAYNEYAFKKENSDNSQVVAYTYIANRINKVFKTNKIKLSPIYHGIPTAFKIANPDYWFVENDGSLSSTGNIYSAVEIISPWIPAKDAEAFIKKFKAAVFDFFDGVTDKKTGFHVNLKTKNAVANPLKLLLLFDQHEELKKFGREHNDYTKPHDIDNLISKLPSYKHYDLTEPTVMRHIAERVIEIMPKEKRFAINVKDYNFQDGSGRIEFRIIGNDYLRKLFETTLNSVNRFIMLMASATDDNTHTEDTYKEFSKYHKAPKKEEIETPEKLLKLAIRDNIRLTPKQEKIILNSNLEIIYDYIEVLVNIGEKVPEVFEDNIVHNPEYVYHYAIITNKRFKRGEPAILKSAKWSLKYLDKVIKDRWEEAEDIIIKDVHITMEYIAKYIKGPFPKGEDIISQSGEQSYIYAKNYLKGPFPKGEKEMQETGYYRLYVKNVKEKK